MREATAVTVDSKDNVYVFNRGNMPVLVFDPDGNVINMWGNDDPHGSVRITEDPYGNRLQFWDTWFMRAHGISCDQEDNLWLVDDVANLIHKYTTDGQHLLTIGTGEEVPRGKAARCSIVSDRRRRKPSDRRRLHLRRLRQLTRPPDGLRRQPHHVVGRIRNRRREVQFAAQHLRA